MSNKIRYNLNEPWKTLDDWQKAVLACKGNIVLRSGRQVGKSAIIAIKVGEYALNHQNKQVMVISKTEKQAQLLFNKILNYIHFKSKSSIKGRPTKHKLELKNGAVIHCLPAGDNGYGIMGYTIDMLVADEAAFIPEEVWNSVIPTLTITKGIIILLSTPFLKEGYYYNCFSDPSFTAFHMSSEDCPRRDVEFLKHQKEILTTAQYAQMYLGQFVDDLKQFFPDKLINETCVGKRRELILSHRDYFLGCDIARMGKDETTFEILDGTNKDLIVQVENIVTKKQLTTDTTKRILTLNKSFNFNKIGIDDNGVGAGILDQLLEEEETKNKSVGINNARKGIDNTGRTRKLLKEDLYNNLLRLMEQKKIILLDDDEIKASLKSVLYEHNELTTKIWGHYTHIVEGIIRAAWLVKDKGLNIYIY